MLPFPSIPIVSHIPRAKHTVQQPSRNPVGSVFRARTAEIKERARGLAGIAPDLQDAPLLAFGHDMVPEEGRSRVGVHADTFDEA